MFDLYHAPDMADYRQQELYDKIANDRLARDAQGTDTSSAVDRVSPAGRIVAIVTDTLAAVGGAIAAAGRRPSRI
jgi:hypothetical protein